MLNCVNTPTYTDIQTVCVALNMEHKDFLSAYFKEQSWPLEEQFSCKKNFALAAVTSKRKRKFETKLKVSISAPGAKPVKGHRHPVTGNP